VHFLIPPNIPGPVFSLTQTLLAPASLPPPPPTPSPVKWVTPPSNSWSIDTSILTIHLPQSSGLPQQISWHRKGDYLATVCKYCATLYFFPAYLNFVNSKWWFSERSMDPSDHTKALAGSVQENQGHSATGFIPPSQAPFLCCCKLCPVSAACHDSSPSNQPDATIRSTL
jgi:hypothetical protein